MRPILAESPGRASAFCVKGELRPSGASGQPRKTAHADLTTTPGPHWISARGRLAAQRLGTPTASALWRRHAISGEASHQPGLHGGCLRRTGVSVLWALLHRGLSRHGVHDPALSQVAAWCAMAVDGASSHRSHRGRRHYGPCPPRRDCRWPLVPVDQRLSVRDTRALGQRYRQPVSPSLYSEKEGLERKGRAGGTVLPAAEHQVLTERWGWPSRKPARPDLASRTRPINATDGWNI
jgi:hypothetical protein